MTTATQYFPLPTPAAALRVQLMERVNTISRAMFVTKQQDAFEFDDQYGNPIRVERLKLAHYGYHYRVSHLNTVNVIPFTNRDQRTQAALWVVNYLRKYAVTNSLRLLPGEALTFQHTYRVVKGKTRSSKMRVVVLGE